MYKRKHLFFMSNKCFRLYIIYVLNNCRIGDKTTMDKFQGILFTLKKRKQYPNVADREFYDFTTFGYYDGLSVSYINQWYQFRPAGVARLCGYVSQGEPFTDIYVIKGFFPEDESADDGLFDYALWREIGQENINKETQSGLKRYPYICLSALHLSQTFVAECDTLEEMTHEVKKYIAHIAEEEKWNLKELHCAVFPIIGFSDYVIAFVSEDFEAPARCISRMREWKLYEKAVISSCYTICGVYKDFKVTKENLNSHSNVRLLAEFSLKEGASAQAFHTVIRDKLTDSLAEAEIDPEWRDKVKSELDNYYITFGNVDTLVMPNINIESYLAIFMSEEFQPGGIFYRNYIIGTKTSICIAERTNVDSSSKSDSYDEDDSQIETIGVECKWREFSYDFEKKLREKNYTVRMSRAIEQIIQNYYNISNTLHGFDIRCSLNNFISATLDDIRICWEDEEADWEEIKSAIKVFRDKVGDFVADLLRSDKPFIEGNTLSHPAIGSATKILFAYTAILNKIADMMSDNDQRIIFLVISGGADATTAIDLFAFVREDKISKEKNMKKPVLIVVPEKGLYDIKGTLFRMLHECMHYCGERLRKERYDLYLDIMAEIMAQDIMRIYSGEGFIRKYLAAQKMYLPPEQYEQIQGMVQKEIENWCKEVKAAVKSCICEFKDFVEYRQQHCDGENAYYESVLFHTVSGRERISGILSDDSIADIWNRKEEPLSEKIEKIIKAEEDKLYERINVILRQKSAHIYTADIRASRVSYWKQKDVDRRIAKYLNVYGAFLVDNYNIGINKNGRFLYNYDKISKLGFWSMRESRADLLAIRLLNMHVEEYLLSFIFEEEGIDRAMPITLDNVLRMGSVLKVGFHISRDDIGTAVRDKIREYADKIKRDAGYEYEDKEGRIYDYLNEYIDRIELLLEIYESGRWKVVAQDIEKYLTDILTVLEGRLGEIQTIEQLREIYRKCDMTDKDNAYATIAYLFQRWEQLAREDKCETEGCTNR